MKYVAHYRYKDTVHQLTNSILKFEDFEEDFKRHTKEGSVWDSVLFYANTNIS